MESTEEFEESKKKLKNFLDNQLKDYLSKEQKKFKIDGFMEVFKDALAKVGIGVKVNHIGFSKENTQKEMQRILKALKNSIATETQFNREDKEIGDSVILIDEFAGCYMHEYLSKNQLSKNHDLPEKSFLEVPGIVVAKEDFTFNCGHCEHDHHSNLVVYFPSVEKRYHIHSKLVKTI